MRLNFSGSSSQVLTGAGTFAPLNTLTGWNTSGSTTFTSNKVGIGTTGGTNALEVGGNGVFTGFVAAQQFIVSDMANINGRITMTNNMVIDGYDPIENSRNEIYTLTQPYYLQSSPGYSNNTIINHNNNGMVGIGTNSPSAKLDVNGDFKVSGNAYYAGNTYFKKITAMPGDSLIHFGDSSMIMNTVSHRIYANPYFAAITTPFGTAYTYIGGMGIGGSGTGTGITKGNAEYSLAIGYGASTGAKKSIALGNFVATSAPLSGGDYNNMVIGCGASSSQKLINNKPNTLMIGFNSNESTLFVGASAGAGTSGQVGIGTTYIPAGYKFAVNGKVIAEELQIKLRTDWPDYVFNENYMMLSLQELDAYIKNNKHLPNTPDAQEIERSGIATGEMLKIQMEKIEELTKYIIEQDRKIEKLQEEVLKLKRDK
jgi:hypothetical protein